MKFKINKKTGFRCFDKELLILDKSGIPFYYLKNDNYEFKFNLPVGTYYTNNNLSKLPNSVFYSKPKLKDRYNFKKVPNGFKIIYSNNPNKCSVDLDKHIIIFDYSFKDKPRFERDFIKFHELGHYFYSGKGQQSEKDCDDFSAFCMIVIGYNPLQIRVASKYSLSNTKDGLERKTQNFNYLQSFKQY